MKGPRQAVQIALGSFLQGVKVAQQTGDSNPKAPGFTEFQTARANPDLFEVKDVDPKELWEKRESVAVIDVRRPDEYVGELGHIAGTRLITLDTLPDHVRELPRDKTIVFVCRSGARSARAAAWALSEGLQSVYNLKGGMLLWHQHGLRIETQ